MNRFSEAAQKDGVLCRVDYRLARSFEEKTMLRKVTAPPVPRWPLWTLAGLLSLTVCIAGAAFAAPVPKDATKKDTKKDAPPKNEELRKERPDKAEPKKSEAEKEIEELIEIMPPRLPPGTDPSAVKQKREEKRKRVMEMSAEQRKNMLAMWRRQPQAALPPAPPAPPMFPGMFGQQHQARLGARVEPPSADLIEQLDLPKGQGLVVRHVLPDSAAAKAGIKSHDVLLELNGKAVPNRVGELSRLLADIKPDAKVEVVVMRKGKKETIRDVKLPETKAGRAGFPAGNFPQPPAFPQAPGVFPQAAFAGAAAGGQSVVTTMTRTQDRFTLRHQEGNLIITLTGRNADGKPKIKEIHVQDGGRSEQYDSVDKVPEQYRDKVKNLVEMSEKGSVHIEIKSP